MKRRILVLFMLFALVLVWAETITIGDGSLTGQSLPIEPYYGYSYSQCIYLQSEIDFAGDITHISWHYDGGTNLGYSNEWVIYLGHTDKTEFTSNSDWVDISELTEVYSGSFSLVDGSEQWIEFDITDYAYNNFENLVIAVEENKSGFNSSSDEFYCTSTGSVYRGLEYHNDSTNPDPTSPPLGTRKTAYANISLSMVSSNPNATPTNLATSNITITSADLAWTEAGTATTWEIEYGPADFVVGEGSRVTGLANTSYALTGLSQLTDYDWYVRSDCGEDGYSNWAKESFSTPMGATDLPYTESFEAEDPLSQWLLYAEGTNSPELEITSTTASEGANSLRINSNNHYSGIEKRFNATTLPTLNFDFKYARYDCAMKVEIKEAGSDTWTDTGFSLSGNINSWHSAEIELGDYDTSAEFWLRLSADIGFYYDPFYVWLDNIVLTPGATEPVFAINPVSKNFGDILVDASSDAQEFTISNDGVGTIDLTSITLTGDNTDQFTLDTTGYDNELSTGESTTISIIFAPTNQGIQSANLAITENTNEHDYPLTGTGIGPAFAVSPEAKDFGTVYLGATTIQDFEISNTAGGTLTITDLSLTGTNADQFSIINTNGATFDISSGESKTISVEFSPSIDGSVAASLNITDNLSRAVRTVALSGTGHDANVTLPYLENFDNVSTPSLPIDWNGIKSNNSFSVITTTTNDYSSPNCGYLYNSYYSSGDLLLVSPPTTTDITTTKISFWARCASGTQNLVIGTMSDNSDASTFTAAETISLSITYTQFDISLSNAPVGDSFVAFKHAMDATYDHNYIDDFSWDLIPTEPNFAITPSSKDFGSVGTGSTSTAQTFTISNTGSEMQIISATITGAEANQFSLTDSNSYPITLGYNESATLDIAFSPTSVGTKTANLTIVDNQSRETHQVSLTGTGVNILSIGEGSFTNQQLPIDPFYGYNYSQTIYTSDNFPAKAITINSISYNYSKVDFDEADDWVIYMATTTDNTLSDWIPITNFDLVYNGDVGLSGLDNGSNWLEITLDTPFEYDPTSGEKLVIAVDENTPGFCSRADEFYCTNAGSIVSRKYFNDNNNPDPSTPPAGSTSTYYPNIRLGYDDDTSEPGTGNGESTGGAVANVDVTPIEINGETIDPDVAVDPTDPVDITVDVVVGADATNPGAPNTNISYGLTFTGNVAGKEITVTLSFAGYTGTPQFISWWNGAAWLTPYPVNWDYENRTVTMTFTMPMTRDGSTEIILGDDNPLPVTLSNFMAQYLESSFVKLNWTTESESNMWGYRVYRSLQGSDEMSAVSDLVAANNLPTTQVYEFIDYEIEAGNTYLYWLESIGLDGTSTIYNQTAEIFVEENVPEDVVPEVLETKLVGNFPNPFNPSTTISFSVNENEIALLTIFNAKGRTLLRQNFDSGIYNYHWNAKKMSSGVYFYRLESDTFKQTKKMLLIK